jgi:hypothetical protein
MNSSIAASMMASRRSAARTARLDGGNAASGDGFDAVAEAAFSRRPGLAGFDGVFPLGPGRRFGMK